MRTEHLPDDGPAHDAPTDHVLTDTALTSVGNRSGRSFRFLLGTGAAEGFGDALTRTLLPILAVAVLGMGTGFVGILNAIGLAAFLLLGMPIGMMVDRRRRRRRAMGAAAALRVLVLAGLAVAYLAGGLSGPLLMGAAVLIGTADVVFTTAQGTVIPAIVARDGLKRAYSRLAVIQQSTSTAAAATAGTVLALLGMPLLLMTAAAAYAGSCLLQFGIKLPPGAGDPAPLGKTRGRFRKGFTTLRRTPALWALTVSACLTNAGAMLGNTVLPVYILDDLAISPAAFAALGVFSAAGAIAGAAAAPRLSEQFGLRTLRAGAALLCVPAVMAAIACQWLPGPALAWLAVQSLAWSFLISVSAVAGAEVLPRSVRPHELATVGSAQRTLTLGVMPIAALLGGLTGALTGPAPLLWVWALLSGAAALPVIATKSLIPFR
jgi:MFS family permease